MKPEDIKITGRYRVVETKDLGSEFNITDYLYRPLSSKLNEYYLDDIDMFISDSMTKLSLIVDVPAKYLIDISNGKYDDIPYTEVNKLSAYFELNYRIYPHLPINI